MNQLKRVICLERCSKYGKKSPYGDGHRQGQVTERSQVHNPHNDRWINRDSDIMDRTEIRFVILRLKDGLV